MPTIFGDKVTIGGITFNDAATRPAGAQRWAIDVLDGWKKTPSMDVISNKIADVDGEVLGGRQSVRARFLTVGGYVTAATRAQSDALEDLLVGQAFPRNVDLQLARYEPVPKFLNVRRVGPIEVQATMENGYRFVLELEAADPFKYGLTMVGPYTAGVAGLSSGGRTYPRTYPLTYTTVSGGGGNLVSLVNAGTASTPPQVTVTGPLVRGGWRLSNETTGEDLLLDIGLGATDVLTIDFANELVYLNGFLASPTIKGDFWRVVPGTNIIKLYADYDPSSSFTISIYSAWE